MSAVEIKTIKWRCDYCKRTKIVRGEGAKMPDGWSNHGLVNRVIVTGVQNSYPVIAVTAAHWCGKCNGKIIKDKNEA